MSELKQTMLGYIHHRLTSMQEVKDAILMWEMLMMKAVDDPGNHQSNTEKKKLAGLMRRLMAYRYEYLKDHRGVNMDETRWKELNGVPHKNMVDVQISLFKECFAKLQKSGFNETTLKSNKLDGILLLIQHMDEFSTNSGVTNYQFGQLLLTLCGKIPDSASTFLQPNETSTSDTSNDPSRSDVTTSGTSNRDASSGTSSDSSNENAMTQQQQQKYEEEMNKRTQKHEEEMNKLRAESAIKEQQRNQEENAMIQQQRQREEALEKKGQELDTLQQQLQREKDLYDEKIAAMLLENQKKLKLARQKTKAANEKVKDMLQRLEDKHSAGGEDDEEEEDEEEEEDDEEEEEA